MKVAEFLIYLVGWDTSQELAIQLADVCQIRQRRQEAAASSYQVEVYVRLWSGFRRR